MEDFNADNAKIDAALAALAKGKAEAAALETASTMAQTALALGQAAFSPDNLPWKIGVRTGTGSVPSEKPVTINVGFPPSFIIIATVSSSGTLTLLSALSSRMSSVIMYAANSQNSSNPSTLTWTDTGLEIRNPKYAQYAWNELNFRYYYIAFR